MLTIQFDPSYPQRALEEAAWLVQFLEDAFTTKRDVEFSEEALAGAQAIFGATSAVMQRAVDAIGAAMKGSNGAPLPMRPGMLATPAAPVRDAAALAAGLSAVDRVPEAAAALMDDLVVVARKGRAPRLTEPKAPAAAKRRRAA
ncbi:MAG: hypothetical protein K2X46_04970 [Roseomonas sp.]|nr:hypothetical protein [Roseomonas sp.]